MSAFNFGRIMIVTKSRPALVFVRSPTAIISNSSRYLCSGKDNINTVSKEKTTSSEQSTKSQKTTGQKILKSPGQENL